MPDSLNETARRLYEAELKELKTEVQEMKADIKDLVEAWKTAKGMTSFVKWLSGVIVAAVSVYAFLTGKKP